MKYIDVIIKRFNIEGVIRCFDRSKDNCMACPDGENYLQANADRKELATVATINRAD